MSISEIVSIVCAIISVIVTIIIGCFQILQNRRLSYFERRQDARDEKRHADEIAAKVNVFMLNHNEDILLLPLCCIAAAYDKFRYYHRALYRDFCCQTQEVQVAILKAVGLDIAPLDNSELFDKCVSAIDELQKNRCNNLFNVFYDNGKYIEYAITRYGKELIPVHKIHYNPPYQSPFNPPYQSPLRVLTLNDECLYDDCLTDILLELKGDRHDFGDSDLSKILESVYHFHSSDEIKACQYACHAARYISLYFKAEDISDNRHLGYIDDFDTDKLTMEDLFLITLFEIWFNLIDTESEETELCK